MTSAQRLEDMSHQADASAAKVIKDMRDRAPLADLLVRLRIPFQFPDHDVRNGLAITLGDARELRHATEVVVQKLFVDRRVLVIKPIYLPKR